MKSVLSKYLISFISLRTVLLLLLGAVCIVKSYASDTNQKPKVITLNSEAHVEQLHYRWADLARFDGFGRNQRTQISENIAGKVKRFGFLDLVTQAELKVAFKKMFPEIYKSVQWRGSDIVNVYSSGIELSAKQLEQQAGEFLQRWLSEDHGDFRVSLFKGAKDYSVPEGLVSLRPQLQIKNRLSEKMCVLVDVLIDREHYQTVPIWYRVEVYQNALVATEDIKRYSEIDVKNFKKMRVNIAGTASFVLDKFSNSRAMRVTKSLRRGELLTTDIIEPVPLVSIGQQVSVFAKSGGVSLTINGIALAEGNQFDTVEIKNTGSTAKYNAVVVGPGKVVVN